MSTALFHNVLRYFGYQYLSTSCQKSQERDLYDLSGKLQKKSEKSTLLKGREKKFLVPNSPREGEWRGEETQRPSLNMKAVKGTHMCAFYRHSINMQPASLLHHTRLILE
jgi:hypothetical protein